jgi:hypothetical protein
MSRREFNKFPRCGESSQEQEKICMLTRRWIRQLTSSNRLSRPRDHGEWKHYHSSKQLARRFSHQDEPKSTSYLIQRISLTVQRGNAVSIIGTIPSNRSIYEVCYLLQFV